MEQNRKTQEFRAERDAKPFEIPVQGSLGLLALGAVGIKAWREKRAEAMKAQDNKNNG